MRYSIILLLTLILTSGCEVVCTVLPVDGRVVDAGSQLPIAHASVTRICAGTPAKTRTDAGGYFKFHGKRQLQLAIGDTIRLPTSYHIEAVGYQSIETNTFGWGWATTYDKTAHFGEIPLSK